MRNRYSYPGHEHEYEMQPSSMWMKIRAMEGVSPFLVLAVCTLLSMGIYIGSSSLLFFTGGATASPADAATLPPFRMAKLQMGMTSAEAASEYPEMTFTGRQDGKQLGSYKFENAAYSVTFMGPEGARKAFRIRYRETFRNYTGLELRQRLKRKFGQPYINHCTRENPRQGLECQLQWQRADGVHLEAVTKTIQISNGVQITELDFAAVDKRLENRIFEPAPVATVKARFKKRKNSAFMMRMRAISQGAKNL